ncbi:MAG TPA: epoxyqueuosine reductase QueH [Deltaproteobacteria bacterium]|nr:epoxyqueuosine reductase QueH [Deltaproteobacteria bacterium]
MKRVLVHMCCGPCSIYPVKKMLEGEAEVTGYFHNPNIHPESEFRRRLDAVKRLAMLMRLDILCDEEYRPEEFVAEVVGPHARDSRHPPFGERCRRCYALRLEATARLASSRGFDAFTSSLLYSRYQDHEAVRAEGERAARVHGVEFLYRDFREGWREGVEKSKEYGLYRQKYCGCIYSRFERYGITGSQ